MKISTLVLAAASALAVAGCSLTNTDALGVIRVAAISQIEALNAAGVDPLQLDTKSLVIATSSCNTVSAVVTVTRPDVPQASDAVLDFCATLAKALAPAE